MKKIPCMLIIFSLILPVIIQAEQTTRTSLTLEECLKIALEFNPLLQSSRQQYQASLARIKQAKAFSQPSIDLDFDLQPSLFNLKKAGETYFGLSQSFEFPGKRFLRGKIASQESLEILQEIELLKLELTFQIKEAFYSLLMTQEKLKLAKQNQELAEDFYEKAKFKYESGEAAQVESLRAHVEASKAANVVRIAENEVRLSAAFLNYLMGKRKTIPLFAEGDLKSSYPSLDLERLKEKAWLRRPELIKLKSSLKKEDFKKKQAYLDYLPDFDLGLFRHRVEGEGSFWDFTLSFPIPLFFWQPKQGEVAEAQANIESLHREIDHIKNAIALQVEEAFINAVTTENQIELFVEEILKEAEEVYNMMLFSYQEGAIGGLELIEARRTLIEVSELYIEALFNYQVALASLEKSAGHSLERGE